MEDTPIPTTATQARLTPIEPEGHGTPPQTNWDDVREPGAYVDETTGDLYRMPQEALVAGASPIVIKESRSSTRLMLISRDPFVTTLQARLLCARHNIQPNF